MLKPGMKKYRLTREQVIELGEAIKPREMVIICNTRLTSTPQERCNKIWERLGDEMGL